MKAMKSSKEKRQSPRIALPCHLRYLKIPKKAREYCNGAVQDVSLGGFMFRTQELFDRNSCLLLDLYLPGAHPIRSLATVAWVKPLSEDNGYQVGGAFVEPNSEVEAAISPFALPRGE